MNATPRLAYGAMFAMGILFWVAVAFAIFAHPGGGDVSAADVAPMATATPQTCKHVATADTIKVYYCEDIYLFVNNLGFMTFEP